MILHIVQNAHVILAICVYVKKKKYIRKQQSIKLLRKLHPIKFPNLDNIITSIDIHIQPKINRKNKKIFYYLKKNFEDGVFYGTLYNIKIFFFNMKLNFYFVPLMTRTYLWGGLKNYAMIHEDFIKIFVESVLSKKKFCL